MNNPATPATPATPAKPESTLKVKRRKLKQARNFIFRILVVIYIVMVLVSGYWYWMRPIRRPQFHYAYTWWSEIAKDYGLPLPSDEMYE